jgi:hypothetical protein
MILTWTSGEFRVFSDSFSLLTPSCLRIRRLYELRKLCCPCPCLVESLSCMDLPAASRDDGIMALAAKSSWRQVRKRLGQGQQHFPLRSSFSPDIGVRICARPLCTCHRDLCGRKAHCRPHPPRPVAMCSAVAHAFLSQ